MATILKVTKNSHFFKVYDMTPMAKAVVMEFAKTFIFYGMQRAPGGRFTKAALRVFAASNRNRTEFRFHINSWKAFTELLVVRNINDREYTVELKPVPIGTPEVFTIKPNWTPKDYQVPAIAYCSDLSPNVNRSKMLPLVTGGGKGYISLDAVSRIGVKVVAVVRPMYIKKWVEEIQNVYDIKPDKIIVAQGSGQLQALLVLAEQKRLDASFIIISNKTYQNWLKLYEEFGSETLDLGYPCYPEDLYEFLGAGVRLIDEVHQDFHLNFKNDLYTNVALSISLSATLLHNDPFLERMYALAYPVQDRYVPPAFDKYNHVKAVHYSFKDEHMPRIRTSEFGSSSYSHNAFEKSIIKNKPILTNYMGMIEKVAQGAYFRDRKDGERLLILCSSIHFCTLLTNYLKTRYPDLKINRFVEDDPYDNLVGPGVDVIISTQLSAGTAHDIPMLRSVIMTIAMESAQGNVQALGRLRKLSIPTTFYYFVCDNIEKHAKYHKSKLDLFAPRVATHTSMSIGYYI